MSDETEAEGTGLATYHTMKSEDGGATWERVDEVKAVSRDSAIHQSFPVKELGVQYVAVAGSFWQPVEMATRPVHYVRTVTSLRPVGSEDPPLAPEEESDEPTAVEGQDELTLGDGSDIQVDGEPVPA